MAEAPKLLLPFSVSGLIYRYILGKAHVQLKAEILSESDIGPLYGKFIFRLIVPVLLIVLKGHEHHPAEIKILHQKWSGRLLLRL